MRGLQPHQAALLQAGLPDLQHPLQHSGHSAQVGRVVLVAGRHVSGGQHKVPAQQAQRAAKQALLLRQPAAGGAREGRVEEEA